MGRYLDMARTVTGNLSPGLACERRRAAATDQLRPKSKDLGPESDKFARSVASGLSPDPYYEINELNELSPPVSEGPHCEISEISEISPWCETWGAAAASTKIVLLHCPPGVPEEWVQVVADLLVMPPPMSCPPERRQTLREDTYTFLRDHAGRAHRLGWTALALFGVHSVKPWVRFDCMGLVPLLNGGRVTALSGIESVIEKPSGARMTFRRRGQVGTEVCLIWELGT